MVLYIVAQYGGCGLWLLRSCEQFYLVAIIRKHQEKKEAKPQKNPSSTATEAPLCKYYENIFSSLLR